MKQQTRSNLLLLLTALIWGSTVVAQRYGAEHLGAMGFNGLRFGLGALSLVPVIALFAKEKPSPASKKQTALAALYSGVALFAAAALQQWGLILTRSASKTGFITGLYTVLVPILGFVFLKHRTGVCTWIGAVLAVAGLYLISMTGAESFGLGDVLLIGNAVVYAVQILVVDRFSKKDIHPLRFACGQFAVCSLLNLAGAALFEEITVDAVLAAGIPILYGGLLSVGVAYTLQIVAQRHAEPTAAAIIMSTESVFAVLCSAVILGENMSRGGYIGCVLMFAGILLSQVPVRSSRT